MSVGNLRSPCCRRDWNKHSVGFSPVSGMGVTGGPDPLAVRLQAASALRAQGGGWEGLRPVLGLTAPAPTEVLCLGPPTLASPGLGAEASSVPRKQDLLQPVRQVLGGSRCGRKHF